MRAYQRNGVPIVPAPADPWAGRTHEVPIVQRTSRRQVYGRVYELILSGQAEDVHEYVGKVTAPTTIHQRVHGKSSSAHTSPKSVAKDPWKARILPGRAGYRQLEVVYTTGDPEEDDRALRRAEAFWIDRLQTVRNGPRPAAPRVPVRPVSAHRLNRREVADLAARRRVRRRTIALALLFAVYTFLAARVILAMELPWPAAPWVASPVAGVILAWMTYAKFRQLKRKLVSR